MTTPWISVFVALWVIVLLLAVVVVGVLRRIGGVLDAAEAQLAANPEGIVAVGGCRLRHRRQISESSKRTVLMAAAESSPHQN